MGQLCILRKDQKKENIHFQIKHDALNLKHKKASLLTYK